MDTIIFVCGLPYSMRDSQLYELFSPHGAVKSARVIMDRLTGRSRGFGFVEMLRAEEAQAAIAAWNNTIYEGQTLFVIEAEPQGACTGSFLRGVDNNADSIHLMQDRSDMHRV